MRRRLEVLAVRGARIALFLVLALQPGSARGVRPAVLHHDLIAGLGRPGFRDGAFTEALFNTPLGLAASPDGKRLYVADRDNHRVRVVRLDQGNRVETLAGMDRAGCADGPRGLATLNQPSALALLPGERLAVYEQGNSLLRQIDLRTGSVSALAGGGDSAAPDAPALSVPLGGVWALAYLPEEDSLYMSQPVAGAIRRLSLRSGSVDTVLKGDARLPRPAALGVFEGRLLVADHESGAVFRLEAPASASAPAVLTRVAQGKGIVALAATRDRLYALQWGTENPIFCLTTRRPVGLASVTGELLKSGPGVPDAYLNPPDAPVGFVNDPRSGRALMVALANNHFLLGIKDYDFGSLIESQHSSEERLTDFAYPAGKADGVFRLLLVGDSRMFHLNKPAQWDWGTGYSREQVLPKRLELLLNTFAALEDRSLRYEVLTRGNVSWEPLLIWPLDVVPQLAGEFDVDRVVLLVGSDTYTLQAYLQRPATEAGVPQGTVDPEYLLEDVDAKILRSPGRRFFELCLVRGWLHIVSSSQIELSPLAVLSEDPEIRKEAIDLLRRPVRLLSEAIRRRLPGNAAPLTICFLPVSGRRPTDRERDLWAEISRLE
jgi:hypothetical protein